MDFFALLDDINSVQQGYFFLNDLRGGETMSDLLDHKEIAHYLKVSPGTIRVWTSKGKIPVLRVGRCTRYSREEIDRWVLKQNGRKPILA